MVTAQKALDPYKPCSCVKEIEAGGVLSITRNLSDRCKLELTSVHVSAHVVAQKLGGCWDAAHCV